MRAPSRPRGPFRRVLDAPGPNAALFAFRLNYPWEFRQAPLFRGMAAAPQWEAVKFCTGATLGDAAVAFLALRSVAAVVGMRWVLRPSVG